MWADGDLQYITAVSFGFLVILAMFLFYLVKKGTVQSEEMEKDKVALDILSKALERALGS